MRDDWQYKLLKDIADYSIGLTYSPKDVSDEGIIVLRSSNVQDNRIDLSDLVRVACPVKEVLKVREGDILMCSRNGSRRLVGKTALIGKLPESMTFGTFMTIIRSKYNPYLLYFFRSNYFRQQIGVGENTMINQITKYMLDAVRVPLPPLREQKRIVTILDEAFEGIDRAIANTEKNLANARILFENYLWSVFTTKGKGWTEHRLGDIVTFIDYRGKTPPKRDGGIRLITAKNVKMGYIRRTPEEFVEPSAYDAWMTRGFPRKGDVLFTTEAPLGNVAQIDTDEKIIIGQRLITFQPDDRVLDRTLLKFALMSQPVQKQIFMRATGATVLGIKASLLKQVPISFPEALLEQAALAAGIQEFSEACRQLGSIYQEKLRALQDLRQALLHKAFTGELSAGTAETVQEAAQ